MKNRDNYRYASSKKGSWCLVCDREVVQDGMKCSVCGTKHQGKKLRLKTPRRCYLGNL